MCGVGTPILKQLDDLFKKNVIIFSNNIPFICNKPCDEFVLWTCKY